MAAAGWQGFDLLKLCLRGIPMADAFHAQIGEMVIRCGVGKWTNIKVPHLVHFFSIAIMCFDVNGYE